MFHSDAAFVTGASHRVCQDYARRGKNSFILSDGCSSSPDSDFGSRMLVKTVENIISNSTEESINGLEFIKPASEQIEMLGLPDVSLDATLMMARVVGANIKVSVFGDGFIFVKDVVGKITIIEINFPSNYPFYLNYLLDPTRLTLLEQVYKNGFKTVTTHTFDAGFKNQKTQKQELAFDGVCGQTFDFNVSQTQFVVAMSDGVASFLNKETRASIPAVDIIKDLCAFKNTVGDAAQRRLNAFLKDAAKKNLIHEDDVSLAVLFALKVCPECGQDIYQCEECGAMGKIDGKTCESCEGHGVYVHSDAFHEENKRREKI